MSEFKIGDVVQLKSGGPLMTVCDVGSGGAVECNWFPVNDASKSSSEYFKGDALKRRDDIK